MRFFRELVLDDHSAFDRAAEVANSFDGLTEIHQELETARKQQQSLQPVALSWEKYQKQERQLADWQTLESLLPPLVCTTGKPPLAGKD
ncbi:hypothetical protein P4909_23675 [Escherichia coli]